MPWLLRDGDVLATVEIAADGRSRRRGLLGRDGIDGALVLRPCRHVHTVGMRFRIDVALVAHDGEVLKTSSLRPWRLAPIARGCSWVVEAESGAFERWSLAPGDMLEVKE